MYNELTRSSGNHELIEPDGTPSVLEAVNRAEIDTQIATARRFPRNLPQAQSRMIAMVCQNPDVAAGCFYALPRKDKNGKTNYIEGPSVRMAEIVAINYGNIRVATRSPVIEGNRVIVEWAAHDLESNYATTGTITARITDKNGNRYSEDMINMTCLAATAKARRNGIFAIVPGSLVHELVSRAKGIASGGDRPIETRRELAMNHFRKFGIDDERILKAVGCTSTEQLDDEKIAALRGIATSIRENETTLEDAFPAAEKPMPTETSGKLDLKGKKQAKPSEPTPAEKSQPASSEPGQYEKLAILLADTSGCSPEEAAEALDDHLKNHGIAQADITPPIFDRIRSLILAGELRPL